MPILRADWQIGPKTKSDRFAGSFSQNVARLGGLNQNFDRTTYTIFARQQNLGYDLSILMGLYRTGEPIPIRLGRVLSRYFFRVLMG